MSKSKNQEEPKLYPARGSAKYRGDLSVSVLGQMMGPTTYGTYLMATQANYDETTDTTTVRFSTVQQS